MNSKSRGIKIKTTQVVKKKVKGNRSQPDIKKKRPPLYETPNYYFDAPPIPREQIMANQILSQEAMKKVNILNKYGILAQLNNSIENYSRGFDAIINKVNETLSTIKTQNVFDTSTHPIIKMCSLSTGQIIHKNIDAICELIVDDLLFELVDALNEIERRKEKQNEKKNFVNFITNYSSHFYNMTKLESEVLKKLNVSKNPLEPYISISDAKELNSNSCNILNPFDESKKGLQLVSFEGLNNISVPNDNFEIMRKNLEYLNLTGYVNFASIHPKLLLRCEDYSKNFKNYMQLKGSFYYPNIFGIYDAVVREFCDEIVKEEIERCVGEVNHFVEKMCNEEIERIKREKSN